jgi:hypothetical protein
MPAFTVVAAAAFFRSAIRLFYHTRHDYSSFFLPRGKKLYKKPLL